MKTLILLYQKGKCSFCQHMNEVEPIYSDGTLLYCLAHAAEEMVRPEQPQSILERYLERLTSKEKH